MKRRSVGLLQVKGASDSQSGRVGGRIRRGTQGICRGPAIFDRITGDEKRPWFIHSLLSVPQRKHSLLTEDDDQTKKKGRMDV